MEKWSLVGVQISYPKKKKLEKIDNKMLNWVGFELSWNFQVRLVVTFEKIFDKVVDFSEKGKNWDGKVKFSWSSDKLPKKNWKKLFNSISSHPNRALIF